jgi:ParB/RepB/Spo0J family partition protein
MGKTKIAGGESREARAARLRHVDPEVSEFRSSFEATPEGIERGVEDMGLLDRKSIAVGTLNHQGTKSTKGNKRPSIAEAALRQIEQSDRREEHKDEIDAIWERRREAVKNFVETRDAMFLGKYRAETEALKGFGIAVEEDALESVIRKAIDRAEPTDLGLPDRRSPAGSTELGDKRGKSAGTNGTAEKSLARQGASPNGVSFVAMQIPVGEIRPFEFQSRTIFDEAYLAELAASMRKVGQLQEAVVRHRPSQSDPKRPWELVIGECRWRAAKIAGVHQLRAREVDVTDEEAIEMNGSENVRRRNLNPIEEARWLKLMIDRCGYTQDSLAAKFKSQAAAGGPKSKVQGPKSQGAVSNKLRLLELPEALQSAIAAGKLSESHATVLIPHARHSGFADAFVKLADRAKWKLESLENFDCDIEETYQSYCESVYGERKLAEQHAEELGLVEFDPSPYGRQIFVSNKKRWKELLAAEAKKASKRADAKDDRAKTQAKKLSPTEAKRREAQLAERHRARVNRWYIAWLQQRIAARFQKRDDKQAFLVGKLMIYFATAAIGCRSLDDVDEAVAGLRPQPKPLSQGEKAKRTRRLRDDFSDWAELCHVTPDSIADVFYALLRKWLTIQVDAYRSHLHEEDVRAIGREMSIDVGKEWILAEDFLALFSKDQLKELIEEWGLVGKFSTDRNVAVGRKVFDNLKRSEVITQILDVGQNRRLPTPAILLQLAKAK